MPEKNKTSPINQNQNNNPSSVPSGNKPITTKTQRIDFDPDETVYYYEDNSDPERDISFEIKILRANNKQNAPKFKNEDELSIIEEQPGFYYDSREEINETAELLKSLNTKKHHTNIINQPNSKGKEGNIKYKLETVAPRDNTIQKNAKPLQGSPYATSSKTYGNTYISKVSLKSTPQTQSPKKQNYYKTPERKAYSDLSTNATINAPSSLKSNNTNFNITKKIKGFSDHIQRIRKARGLGI